MTLATAFIFAFLCGLAIASACGYYAQWREGVPAGFRPPFVTRERMVRSIVLSVFAGPFLLTNELRAAWRMRDVSATWIVAGAGIASAWMLASGIVILGVSEQIAGALRAFSG